VGSQASGQEVITIDIKVETRVSGDWAVVDVEGEVDVFTAPKLREQIIGLLTAGRDRIVVNLEKVDFMDSTGLGVLVGGLKRVKEKEGSLALAGAHGTVLRVLTVTGLNSVFPLHETVEKATASN
jgi:anti-sigma B factor antagonist